MSVLLRRNTKSALRQFSVETNKIERVNRVKEFMSYSLLNRVSSKLGEYFFLELVREKVLCKEAVLKYIDDEVKYNSISRPFLEEELLLDTRSDIGQLIYNEFSGKGKGPETVGFLYKSHEKYHKLYTDIDLDKLKDILTEEELAHIKGLRTEYKFLDYFPSLKGSYSKGLWDSTSLLEEVSKVNHHIYTLSTNILFSVFDKYPCDSIKKENPERLYAMHNIGIDLTFKPELNGLFGDQRHQWNFSFKHVLYTYAALALRQRRLYFKNKLSWNPLRERGDRTGLTFIIKKNIQQHDRNSGIAIPNTHSRTNIYYETTDIRSAVKEGIPEYFRSPSMFCYDEEILKNDLMHTSLVFKIEPNTSNEYTINAYNKIIDIQSLCILNKPRAVDNSRYLKFVISSKFRVLLRYLRLNLSKLKNKGYVFSVDDFKDELKENWIKDGCSHRANGHDTGLGVFHIQELEDIFAVDLLKERLNVLIGCSKLIQTVFKTLGEKKASMLLELSSDMDKMFMHSGTFAGRVNHIITDRHRKENPVRFLPLPAELNTFLDDVDGWLTKIEDAQFVIEDRLGAYIPTTEFPDPNTDSELYTSTIDVRKSRARYSLEDICNHRLSSFYYVANVQEERAFLHETLGFLSKKIFRRHAVFKHPREEGKRTYINNDITVDHKIITICINSLNRIIRGKDPLLPGFSVYKKINVEEHLNRTSKIGKNKSFVTISEPLVESILTHEGRIPLRECLSRSIDEIFATHFGLVEGLVEINGNRGEWVGQTVGNIPIPITLDLDHLSDIEDDEKYTMESRKEIEVFMTKLHNKYKIMAPGLSVNFSGFGLGHAIEIKDYSLFCAVMSSKEGSEEYFKTSRGIQRRKPVYVGNLGDPMLLSILRLKEFMKVSDMIEDFTSKEVRMFKESETL